MYTADRMSFPPRNTHLLRHGELVSVTLVVNEQTPHEIVTGTLTGFDEFGLLVDQGEHGSIFVPWSSVRTIRRPPAH
ncbi:MAG: hypothetical protein ACLQUY_19680 [Ktedonobacterales bacterium]